MVHQVITCIQNWVNLFQADQSICHLESGRIAPDDLVGDLLQAHERDTKALEDSKLILPPACDWSRLRHIFQHDTIIAKL